MIKYFLISSYFFIISPLAAQIGQQGQGFDESQLYATTKQVGQFFKRFNGEEDAQGERLYPKDQAYRSEALRKQYLSMLFNESGNIAEKQQIAFANFALSSKDPQFLDFHTDGWFAELNAVFVNKEGKEENVLLFLKIEEQGQGNAWVLYKASHERYKKALKKQQDSTRKFIHPMSHELDFMNLHKAFRKGGTVDYTADAFKPDHLSILMYELNTKQIQFKTVQSVNFHFFQVAGWYFQISEFNRSTNNNGWLISDLSPIKKEDVATLKSFIYEGQ